MARYFEKQVPAASLAFFRIAFGLMMAFGVVRFVGNGWVEKFYIKPDFHFTYYGFSWVKPLGVYTYLIFVICGLSALAMAVGWRYRTASALFFLSWTYAELMDKTTYLNHYYFVSVIAFVMMLLPANAYFSADALRKPKIAVQYLPQWQTDLVKLLLGMVYFYAGLAKLNSDWLFHAQPLRIWLPAHSAIPAIGPWLNEVWVAYAFSWIGAAYDLSIPFLLLNRKTRIPAFILVVVFHVLTRMLFPIGIFPFVMIGSTLIFFSSGFHTRCLSALSGLFRLPMAAFDNGRRYVQDFPGNVAMGVLAMLLMVQLAFPFRYLLYPGELFWTEEGFRFSWRVMLMEKAGYTEFFVTDRKSGETTHVRNRDFLTAFQEKQMAFQPDFIVEYAHYLHDFYDRMGYDDPIVRAESYVALNGRRSRLFINPDVDLSRVEDSFAPKTWLMPFDDEISGL